MSSGFDPWEEPTFPEPLAEGLPAHPRPRQSVLDAERTPVEGACPDCGAAELSSYRVLSEGGWWRVTKCQACLASVSREPAALFGSYKPLGLIAPLRFGKAAG